ncbi:MAG: hypothetical protein WDM70_10335 [Nitrosomonadales bacterium]
MKKSLVSLFVAVALIPVVASAGMFDSLPSLGGGSGGGDLIGAQDKLIVDYITADQFVLAGQAKMAEALGLKTEAAAFQAKADGINKDNVADSDKSISSDAVKAIQEAQAKHPVLDNQAKANYALGVVSLAKGVLKYVSMKDSFQNFSKSLSSAPMTMLPKLATGAAIVKSLPTNAKNMSDALSSAVQFSKDEHISLPNDASASVAWK